MSTESVAGLFRRIAGRHPDRIALVYLGEPYTYAELDEASARLAAALGSMGVRRGQRAIIFLPNVPQWLVAWLALQEIGAIAVPITPHYAANDLEFIAKDSGAETIFCLDTNFGYVERVLRATPIRHVVVTGMADLLPAWKRALGRALDRVPEGRVRFDDRTVAFRSMLRRGRPAPAALPSEGSDPVEILYTGGTTGDPKGVPISGSLLLEALREQRRASAALVPPGEDVVIQGAPLYHILGQAVGLGAVLHGDRIVLLPRVNLDAMLDHITRYRATTLFGVPALFRMILEHDRIDQYDLGSLRYCFSGGDVMPTEVARRWQRRFGKPIYNGYGATETAGGIALTPVDVPAPEGTVGKPVAFQRVLIVDEQLVPVPNGESGEALVSSEHMVRAYWNNPEETARCFVEIDGATWYRTRDILRRDDEGWLYFVDRTADVIKHKGYRVAASRIEAVLQEHPAVVASCAVGVPDPIVGERIKAFAVLTQDARGVTAHDLLSWCRERLAAHEVPHYIEFRDMLPKSKVGKLLRRELRDEERALARSQPVTEDASVRGP